MKIILFRPSCRLFVAFAMMLGALPSFATLYQGEDAPRFTAYDQNCNRFSLGSKIGKQLVLLYFYPKDDTASSTEEARGLRDQMIDLKRRDIAVVGISFDNAKSHRKFSFKYNLNFPLLSDSWGEITDAYGVRMWPARKMDRQVTILIGLDGKIAKVVDSPDPVANLREMEAAIRELQSGAAR